MATTNHGQETLDDLYRVDAKAELIGGRIVRLTPTERKPNRVAGRIYRSLDDYANETGICEAYTDNIGFTVPELRSGRQSFSPDASYFTGPFSENSMRFLSGPPKFAVEVRSEGDYGDTAEATLAEKRADYFAAGTQVAWDVDPPGQCIHVYRSPGRTSPVTYQRGEMAEAEPAVPGWNVDVNWIFE